MHNLVLLLSFPWFRLFSALGTCLSIMSTKGAQPFLDHVVAPQEDDVVFLKTLKPEPVRNMPSF